MHYIKKFTYSLWQAFEGISFELFQILDQSWGEHIVQIWLYLNYYKNIVQNITIKWGCIFKTRICNIYKDITTIWMVRHQIAKMIHGHLNENLNPVKSILVRIMILEWKSPFKGFKFSCKRFQFECEMIKLWVLKIVGIIIW